MMEILVFAGIPVLLLLLLSMLGATWNLDVDAPGDAGELQPRNYSTGRDSTQCITRIFSPEDQRFIKRQGSPRLLQIYRAERTRVALYWVRMVSAEVGQTMRQHRMAAGAKQNLQVRRELALIVRYVEFRMLCSLLVFSIRVFGPHALGNVAAQLLQLSQGIGRVLDEAAAAGRIEPAGNLGSV
jgi:hypothetical protein